jgi:DNA-directed RNA polymerase subunit RPC12/RpoP
MANLEDIENFQKKEENKVKAIQKIRDMRCSWCDKPITNDEDGEYIFWQCRGCGVLFCYDCSHQKGELKSKDYVKCKCVLKDTIWERKVLKEQEEDEL